jgi:hypothetical protein
VPSLYCCTAHPELQHLEKRANSLLYGLFCMAQQQQNSLENCDNPRLNFCALFLLLYELYGSIQYRLQQQKINSATKQKYSLGICAHFVLGNVPSMLPYFFSLKPTRKFSLNLLLLCLAHYPMHSFINLKMIFSLQSVFSPSSTLNPKAKI